MPKNKNGNPIFKYLIPIAVGVIIFIIITLIIAFITVKTPYPKENTLLYGVISISVSSFISSFIFSFKERKNGMVSGLIIGFVLTVIMFLIYSVFSSFKLNESSLLIIPSSIIPSALAGVLAVNMKRK